MKLFFIKQQAVEDAVKEMSTDLLVVVLSTMRHHQLVSVSPGGILYFNVSRMYSATVDLECDGQKNLQVQL